MAASATNMKTKKTFGQWFKSRKVHQWLVIVSFMIVPVLLLLVFHMFRLPKCLNLVYIR